MPGVTSYPSRDLLLEDVKSKVLEGESKAGRKPRVLVFGALGRCGRGAVDLCKQAGLPDENILKWDLPETTAKPGPYTEITDSDVFVNYIYLRRNTTVRERQVALRPRWQTLRCLRRQLRDHEPAQFDPHLQGEQHV